MPNAKREYDVIGFLAVAGNQNRELSTDPHAILHVRYFVPPAPDSADSAKVFIQVQEMTGRTSYLMKAGPAPTEPKHGPGWNSFSWPAADVIATNDINTNDLSVVVRLGSDNEYNQNLAPALFFTGDSPPAPITGYELILQLEQYSLKSVACDYSYKDKSGSMVKAECSYKSLHSCKPHPEPGDLEVESLLTICLKLADAPAGPVNLQIVAPIKNSSNKLEANYHFYHQPQ